MPKSVPPPGTPQLSRRERQIMDVVYRQGSATAAEIHSHLPDPPVAAAVRTMLRILEEKGHLRHEKDGPRHVYYPVTPRNVGKKRAPRREKKGPPPRGSSRGPPGTGAKTPGGRQGGGAF